MRNKATKEMHQMQHTSLPDELSAFVDAQTFSIKLRVLLLSS